MHMELRMLVAIILSFLVFFVYQALFVKKVPVPEKQPEGKTEVVQGQQPPKEKAVRTLPEKPSVEKAIAPRAERPVRKITVSTGLYEAELTEKGAGFRSFKLKKYRESLAADSPMKQLIRLPGEMQYTPRLSLPEEDLPQLDHAVFRAETDSDHIDATKAEKSLTFTWISPDGVTILKTYSFLPNTYKIGLKVTIKNLSSRSIGKKLMLSLRNKVNQDKKSRYVFSGPAALIDDNLKEIKLKKIASENYHEGNIRWIAYEDLYFVSAITPEKVRKAAMSLHMGPKGVLETTYEAPSEPVLPKSERIYLYNLYFGPKSIQSLKQAGSGLEKMVDFGFFDIIAKPLFYLMTFMYRYIPNYGVAIIIITLLTKLLFWPLSNKSYKSMDQMKRLQPMMAEIREKYKDDKQMMNKELMNLYKVYKVNPLGGCLPMILQIPVFFAFYKMLYEAIELRHAPFCLWINDLSAPDRLFTFNFKVPLMAPPYGIPMLTIIMGISMFFQQKMSPPPGDPAQAKIMLFMPILFTFIFINFPSGLVLYWLVNNVLSMIQQYYITKKTTQ